MKKYWVTNDFHDRENDGELVKAGTIIEVDDERADALRRADVIGKEATEDEANDDLPGLKHTGGGWYELPDGDKVHGKDKALEALAALKAGGTGEATTDNTAE